MIKTIFWPFFKRFFGLFISMVFVSMLSVGLLCCFGSVMLNLSRTYKDYLNNYGDIDCLYATQYNTRSTLETVAELPEVKEIYSRFTLDAYVKRADRTILGRIHSYDDTNENSLLFKRYVLQQTEKTTENGVYNVSVARKFAKNNKFALGDIIEVGYLDYFVKCYISEIVETAEGIYPRANNYIWTDNFDFGYMYVSEAELNRMIEELAKNLDDSHPDGYSILGLNIPIDLYDVVEGENFASKVGNQVMVKFNDGVDVTSAMEKVDAKYKDENVEVTSATTRKNLPYVIYMDHCLEQLSVASVFLPIFFYAITMIVVGLFIQQIIKAMTSQIGIFMSIGIDANEIVGLFILFTMIMGLVSGLLGSGLGFALNILMSSIMRNTYSIPTITPALAVWVAAGAIVGLLIFILVTTLITTRAIFRITPKDAVISNEAKRKKMPKAIEKFIDKAPMNIKLGVNSIVQNPRRFFVSSFAIFASLVLILLSTLFSVSKNEMIDQSLKRRLNYDCQVYMTEKVSDEFVKTIENSDTTTVVEDAYYTYVKVDNTDKNVFLECLAVDPGMSDLINIPNSFGKGKLSVPETGLILPKSYADKLGLKKGDTISLYDKKVEIVDISYQYFHPITYLSKNQMKQLTDLYVSSLLVNVTNEAQFVDFLRSENNRSLTVFTRSLSRDLKSIFDSVDIMIWIMVGFSVGMAFIILWIMSQNALMEQQRSLSIYRAIGFTILDVSNVWTLQSIFQILLSSIFAIPVGCIAIMILTHLASSSSQIYPFVISVPTILIGLAFVLAVVVACHLLAMFRISKWNLADNTRTRE